MTAPITLFAYSRPDHTQRTVEALQKNLLASESDLIIYSDAARSPAKQAAVDEVRAYLATISGFRSVTIKHRSENYGLAKSIIQGVTEVLQQSDRVIVLEDDLITSSYFLTFMNDALERYRNEEQVMQIGGYMFPVEIQSDDDAFFLPFTTSWGWATWKRAWDVFDASAKSYSTIKDSRTLRKKFDLDGSYPYFKMLESQLKGEIDSWAIRWYLSVFSNQGIVLFPKNTLITNNGFDGSGTHCEISAERQMELNTVASEKLPTLILVNPDHKSAVVKYFLQKKRSKLKRWVSDVWRAIKA